VPLLQSPLCSKALLREVLEELDTVTVAIFPWSIIPRCSAKWNNYFPWRRCVSASHGELYQPRQPVPVGPPINPRVRLGLEIKNLESVHIFDQGYPALILFSYVGTLLRFSQKTEIKPITLGVLRL